MSKGVILFLAAATPIGVAAFSVATSFWVSNERRVAASTDDSVPDFVAPKVLPQLNAGRFYVGPVKALGRDWVDLGPGWEGSQSDKRPVQKDDTTTPLRLSAAGPIVAGELKIVSYRLIDLKVGDIVLIDSGICPKGELYCMAIDIVRRPGGKIPPVPGQALELHLRNQAQQDWEEKGIPIPARYLDHDGRCRLTNPPYPPVAPQPRPAKP
ncbi:MAG: hypothetical protein C0501_12235 [Isosphaera sp.]|nr:hypothetical protein [Isosphaera sp.]